MIIIFYLTDVKFKKLPLTIESSNLTSRSLKLKIRSYIFDFFIRLVPLNSPKKVPVVQASHFLSFFHIILHFTQFNFGLHSIFDFKFWRQI